MSNSKKINIIGCGFMGSQISCFFSLIGYEVNIWNRNLVDIEILKKKKKLISKTSHLVDKNGLIKFHKDLSNLENNVTLECLSEDFEIKKKYFIKIKKIINKDIFSNTSSIKLKDIYEEIN